MEPNTPPPEYNDPIFNQTFCGECQLLVQICLSLQESSDSADPTDVFMLPHHGELRELKLQADRGCELCGLLIDALPHYSEVKDRDTGTEEGDPVASWLRRANSHVEDSASGKFWDPQYKVSMRPSDGTIRPQSANEVGVKVLHPWTGSAINFCTSEEGSRGNLVRVVTQSIEVLYDVMGSWMHECLHDHQYCKKNRTSRLPTRVLDLAHIDSSADLRLKVTHGEHAPYAALSHCWGGLLPFKTTRKALDARKSRIPYDELPRTFRDAVVIARALGIRYLWIDALCILQKDENEDLGSMDNQYAVEDWRNEADHMANVYQNAQVTLSGLLGRNSSDGIIAPRQKLNTVKLMSENPLGPQNNLFTQKAARTFNDVFADASIPLNQRGWVLQERVLSQAVLHFGPDQMFWECRSLCAAENGWRGTSNPVLKGFMIDFSLANIRDIPQLWYPLVEDYSTRKLTFQSDKTIAISGLIDFLKQRNEKYQGHCIQGIWQGDIKGLLWSVIVPGSIDSSQRTTFPSWSWTWMDGAISYWCSKMPLSVGPPADSDCEFEIVYSSQTVFYSGFEERHMLKATGINFPVTAEIENAIDRSVAVNQFAAPSGLGVLRVCWDHLLSRRENFGRYTFFQVATIAPSEGRGEMHVVPDSVVVYKTFFLILGKIPFGDREGLSLYRREGIGWFEHVVRDDRPFLWEDKELLYIA